MTLKEIARLVNVSIGTVSLALRDSPKIKQETRDKIKKIAQLTHYRPNLAARSLLNGRSFAIGVVFPSFKDLFYGELLTYICQNVRERNYAVLFFPVENLDEYRPAIESLLSRRVDGIILTTPGRDALLKLKEEKIPFVVYSDAEMEGVHCVMNDYYMGGYMAASYFIRQGHKRIGYVGMTGQEMRFLGFRDALYRHHLELREQWIAAGPGYQETGYEGMRQILSGAEKPTAIFTHNDVVAIGAMRAIFLKKLRVPADIAVIGFNNIAISKYLPVALTTVDQRIEKIAQESVNILFHAIAHPNEQQPKQVKIKPRLIVRESSGAPMTAKPAGSRKHHS